MWGSVVNQFYMKQNISLIAMVLILNSCSCVMNKVIESALGNDDNDNVRASRRLRSTSVIEEDDDSCYFKFKGKEKTLDELEEEKLQKRTSMDVYIRKHETNDTIPMTLDSIFHRLK